jgi:GH43 family beta-xylosidase
MLYEPRAAAQRQDFRRLLRRRLRRPGLRVGPALLQPMSASSWTKSPPRPIFQRDDAAGVYGPGHNGFFKSSGGTDDWIVYHLRRMTAYRTGEQPADKDRRTTGG